MPVEFHRLVQHAAHANDIRAGAAIQQKMPGGANTAGGLRPRTCMAQMIGADTLADLGPRGAAKLERIGRDSAQPCADQRLVTPASGYAEVSLPLARELWRCPSSHAAQAARWPRSAFGVCGELGRLPSEFRNVALYVLLAEFVIPPGVEVRKTGLRGGP